MLIEFTWCRRNKTRIMTVIRRCLVRHNRGVSAMQMANYTGTGRTIVRPPCLKHRKFEIISTVFIRSFSFFAYVHDWFCRTTY